MREQYPTLENTGYVCHKNVFSPDEVNHLLKHCEADDYVNVKKSLSSSNKLKNLISNTTQSIDYILQDYIFIIKRSMVHTCHRDYNGDFFNPGQKHPSYTMLIYLEKMEKCLSVLPVSHKNPNSYFFNFTKPLTDIKCGPGDIILFNANLIHVGSFNEKDDNIRIQMKVSHKDDIPVLSYYQNYNKVLNQANSLPGFIRRAQQSLSCTFPGIANLTQTENIRSSRDSDMSWFQRVFSYLFYGKGDFYDLPDALSPQN
uniref:Phytanoyl-CoA dioxygenase n=1 Tax=viral metagenome TaxID=1070528 RepID=A0A6C0D4D5_9ZZZZ